MKKHPPFNNQQREEPSQYLITPGQVNSNNFEASEAENVVEEECQDTSNQPREFLNQEIIIHNSR